MGHKDVFSNYFFLISSYKLAAQSVGKTKTDITDLADLSENS